MHQLIVIAALAAAPELEPAAAAPEPEAFIDGGGIHLAVIGVSHSVALATVFALQSGGGPYVEMPVGLRVVGTLGVLLAGGGGSLLMAHFFRPSVGAAWMSALLNLTAVLAGIQLAGDPALRRPTVSGGGGLFDPDYAVAMALAAGFGVVSSFLALVPPDRGRMSLWTVALITGAMTVVTAAAYFIPGAAGWLVGNTAAIQTWSNVVSLIPALTALSLRLLQAALLPNLFVTPQVVPGGGGLSFSTPW